MADKKEGTLAALLEEKRRRGRPRRAISRRNVYVALSTEQKDQMRHLAGMLPAGLIFFDHNLAVGGTANGGSSAWHQPKNIRPVLAVADNQISYVGRVLRFFLGHRQQ